MKDFVREIGRGRMLGHPMHMMLVHFPAALWPFGFVLDLLGAILRQPGLAAAGFYALAGGTVGGAAAAVFGAVDYFRMPSGHPGWTTASWHALLNSIWLMTFGTLAGIRAGQYPGFTYATPAELAISFAAVIGVLLSNHLGGRLVLRYSMGKEEHSGNS